MPPGECCAGRRDDGGDGITANMSSFGETTDRGNASIPLKILSFGRKLHTCKHGEQEHDETVSCGTH